MYYDRHKASKIKKNAEKFEELKKFISSRDENLNVSEWSPALDHILSMEMKISEQKKQLEKYQSFFSLMRELLPRESSTSRTIG